jgi:cytochrome c5
VQQKEKPKLPSLLGKKVWLPTAEWETIKEAINGTTNIPLDTPRNILMGYQYALHLQGKRMLQEREIITTQCASASAASRAAREECMNVSYTNSGRHHRCCRGDDLGGAPRAGQYAGWRPRKSHGLSVRRPAPPEGPAAPAAG